MTNRSPCSPVGFTPSRVLPVVIDVGTNNVELRNDPKYLGLKRPRITGQEYYALVDEVRTACVCPAEGRGGRHGLRSREG